MTVLVRIPGKIIANSLLDVKLILRFWIEELVIATFVTDIFVSEIESISYQREKEALIWHPMNNHKNKSTEKMNHPFSTPISPLHFQKLTLTGLPVELVEIVLVFPIPRIFPASRWSEIGTVSFLSILFFFPQFTIKKGMNFKNAVGGKIPSDR